MVEKNEKKEEEIQHKRKKERKIYAAENLWSKFLCKVKAG